MVVTTIYVVRHAIRATYTVDPETGKYHSQVPIPTGLDGDVPLAAKGVAQAKELAIALTSLPISRYYSSPFYRCLQTIAPFATSTSHNVRVDPGIGEWYGRARFSHPIPASISTLKPFFPFIDDDYPPTIIPCHNGETVDEMHDRVAFALTTILAREDLAAEAEDSGQGGRAILIATHAASMIAIGRTLTGRMPADVAEDDFQTFTAGMSRFVRKEVPKESKVELETWDPAPGTPKVDWRDGKGIAGGWECVVNSDCSYLTGGAERGWSLAEAQTFV
ncbi:uncharacterized protein KY384_006512 [Bacidia gigantensis]|uniref:uncharacterized protein n=1 Tax=Bacidia gigantensis TaxID=2732470 RepID=UPI001D052DD2|nr:uncharacterized protein KY384_006512 [Bacidia gigantensis]KAG8528823.1 hypothetical protein KY384_006512 [Bacidia gigantensis]